MTLYTDKEQIHYWYDNMTLHIVWFKRKNKINTALVQSLEQNN